MTGPKPMRAAVFTPWGLALAGWGLLGTVGCVAQTDAPAAETSSTTDDSGSQGAEADAAGTTSSAATGHESVTTSEDGESSGAPTGCGDQLAAGATVRDVSFFQVVEVATLRGGAEIAVPQRTAPLVADRAAVARIRVGTAAGWTARRLAVEVSLTSAGGQVSLTAERWIGGPDTEQPDDAFVVEVPADAVQPGAEYAVRLVECEPQLAGDGASQDARYPRRGNDALEVVRTGPIKIHLVPFEIGGFVPDTSQEVVDGFREAVLAVYPATEVQISVGETVPDRNGGALDMGDLLVRLGQQQEQQDQAPPQLYYYGLVTGAATREEFCDACPTGTSESGGGGRAGFSVGAAFADQQSEDTLIHELGHMHGLLHAPCGDPDLLDEGFPHADAELGVEGFDMRTAMFVPADHKDLMAYCYPRWVSDYHYRKMIDWVQLAQTWTRQEAPAERAVHRFVCP